MLNHNHFMFNASCVTNYSLMHLIRKNQSVTHFKYVLWCGGWRGEVRRPCLPLLRDYLHDHTLLCKHHA